MKLTLKPLFHTRLKPVTVEDGEFLIGRFEEPFDSCKEPFVAKLSRRHALILVVPEGVHLVDLASLNGTKVNGQPLRGNVVAIRTGDKITLAEQAIFQAALAPEAQAVPLPVQLVLAPLSEHAGGEPLEPTALPWLISAADGRWVGCAEQPPATAPEQKLRPQALLSFKDGDVQVTDLSHPATTQVDGYLLEGETVPLKPQTRLAFGDGHAYSVRIKKPSTGGSAQDPQATTAIEISGDSELSAAETQLIQTADIKKTTYVETPKSFLDLLNQSETLERPATEIVEALASPARRPSIQEKSAGKIRAWAQRLRAVVPGGRELRLRELCGGAALVVALIGGIALFYWWNAAERQIKQLLEQNRYAESAKLANSYLKFHADDVIGSLGVEALIRYVVPYWLKSLEQTAFAEAGATLDRAAELTPDNEPGRKALQLLQWMTDLDRFFAERGELSLVIFRDESRIQDLLDRWDEGAGGRERLLGTITKYEPAFEGARSRALSGLRALRSEASVYLKAVDALKVTVAQKLQMNRPEELVAVFSDFAVKYPKIGGMDALNRDLERYLALKEVVQTKTLDLVPRFLQGDLFTTPPFRDRAAEVARKELPSKEILAEYEEAGERWRAGEMSQAMAVLALAKTQKWGEVAARRFERYQRIATDFKRLQLRPQNGECDSRLFDFRGALSRAEDTFFLKAIEADFQRCRPQILNVAEESFNLAKDAWDAYRDAGGINGRLRLETTLSENFRQQAKRLADAGASVARAERIYEQLGTAYPPARRKLCEQIIRELKQQRQSLDDLNVVLEPDLLKRKLDMLPLPQQDNS